MASTIYAGGVRVWLEDKELGWTSGEVAEAVVKGADVTLTLTSQRHRQPLVVRTTLDDIANNASRLPPLRNSDDFDLVNDLSTLPQLNEPSSVSPICQSV